MKNKKFFEKQTVSSRVKADIISEYFPDYCKIISKNYSHKSIRYIDLFSGPGIYEDGNYSTPLLVGINCSKDDFLRKKAHLIFNDKYYSEELAANFSALFSEDTFEKKPRFGNKTVGESQEITNFLTQTASEGTGNPNPTVLFIDPFGYKGIETKVLAEFLRKWGNEVFLFVNTKRIHPALENDKFEELMQDLFPSTLDRVKRDRRYQSSVSERLNLIINSLGYEYNSILNRHIYYTAFRFQEEDSISTSHYILHLTKSSKGFELIKTIYNDFANVGTIFDGINTYTFDAKSLYNPVSKLFDENTKSLNIDKLKGIIQSYFATKTISALELFEIHHKENLYSRSHYTQALRRLVSEGLAEATFTDEKEHRVSVLISKYCILTFK